MVSTVWNGHAFFFSKIISKLLVERQMGLQLESKSGHCSYVVYMLQPCDVGTSVSHTFSSHSLYSLFHLQLLLVSILTVLKENTSDTRHTRIHGQIQADLHVWSMHVILAPAENAQYLKCRLSHQQTRQEGEHGESCGWFDHVWFLPKWPVVTALVHCSRLFLP